MEIHDGSILEKHFETFCLTAKNKPLWVKWVYKCKVYCFIFLPHIESVVDMSTDELHSHKVITLAAIEEDQPILIRCLELKVDVDHVISLELGQSQVCVVRCEGDWLVDRVLHVLEFYIAWKRNTFERKELFVFFGLVSLFTFIFNLFEVCLIKDPFSIYNQALKASLEVLLRRSCREPGRESGHMIHPDRHGCLCPM